ncbi:MAG TPA: COX15/CtaA family protein [Pyrinomonadaceae bacterium]|nr:COX15/CtaA family protein [Pyrinomonadaceae bacterium]
MQPETKQDKFARFAWLVLGWNIIVILWGVFLRASKSGDGCGQHWLTCQGEVIPSAPALKTVIEFSHRITSSLDGLLLIGLLVWAFLVWKRVKTDSAKRILKMAAGSFVFVVIEGLLGAGLVLTGNTAETLTPERPFWMAAHLVNTLILLTFLTLTARYASGGKPLNFRVEKKYLLAILIGFAAILLVGITGSIAALSHMIFPSGTIAEGIAKDFSPTSNILLRLRLLHPITAILTSVFVIFLTGWLTKECGKERLVVRWSNILSILILAQIAFGSLTLLTLAPILMQLGHLLFVDLIWISYVMFAASFLSTERPIETVELDAVIEP